MVFGDIVKTLIVSKNSLKNLLRGQKEFYDKDFTQKISNFIPGEWVRISDDSNKKNFLGFVNPFVDKGPKVRVIGNFENDNLAEKDEEEVAKLTIENNLVKAISLRKLFLKYHGGSRLIYGDSDNLPGLIVDKYTKYIIAQVNSAGLDRFREQIKQFFKNAFPDIEILFLDNEQYRKSENLPSQEHESLSEALEIEEDGLLYSVPKSAFQKIGYYYDHRENRRKLEERIKDFDYKFKKGLDLFCYAGSWGMHLLRAGVEKVTFVDRGKVINSVGKNLELNSLPNSEIVEDDVFHFLDEAQKKGETFDLVVSDPPAFSKAKDKGRNATIGYEKLHRKIFKVLSDKAFFVAASCTKNISLEELDKTVYSISKEFNKKVHMIDIGMQGMDHPISHLKDKGNYLKYILYYVSNNGEQ